MNKSINFINNSIHKSSKKSKVYSNISSKKSYNTNSIQNTQKINDNKISPQQQKK